jgi:S1-C subfamily serine protease
VIVSVEDGSLAEKSGLSAGDVISEVNKAPVKNSADFEAAAKKARGNCLVKTSRGYFVIKAQ